MIKNGQNSKGKMSKSYPERVNEFYDNIPEDVISLWVETHKDKDVMYQIKRAKCWLLDNQHKKRKNFRSFTSRWLNKEDNGYNKPKKIYKPKKSLDFQLFKDNWNIEEKLNEDKTKRAWYSLEESEQNIILKVLPHSMELYAMKMRNGEMEIEHIPQAHNYIISKKYNNYKLLEAVRRDEWAKKEAIKTLRMRTPEQNQKIINENRELFKK